MTAAGNQTGTGDRVIGRCRSGVAYVEIDEMGTIYEARSTGYRHSVGIMARGTGASAVGGCADGCVESKYMRTVQGSTVRMRSHERVQQVICVMASEAEWIIVAE